MLHQISDDCILSLYTHMKARIWTDLLRIHAVVISGAGGQRGSEDVTVCGWRGQGGAVLMLMSML